MQLTGETQILGVIGDPIHHSKSPSMHQANIIELGLNMVYVPFHVKPNELERAINGLRGLNILGINVTVPHKESVMALLDDIDPLAKKIGAVNTIANKDGRLIGYNTDGLGLIKDLKQHTGNLPKHVAIIGAGGSAKSIGFSLIQEGIDSLIIINRTLDRANELKAALKTLSKPTTIQTTTIDDAYDSQLLHEADLVIQTTSVGLNSADCVFKTNDWATKNQVVYDIIYHPKETTFLKQARQKSAKTINGNGMLVHQGAVAFELITGISANVDAMWSVF